MKKFIFNFIFINTLIFSLLSVAVILYFSWDTLEKNSNLIAVQWCKKSDSPATSPGKGWFAIYLYSEQNEQHGVAIRGWLIDYRVANAWDPVRYKDTEILGVEDSEEFARKNWGTITCLDNNEAQIGSSGKSIQWEEHF